MKTNGNGVNAFYDLLNFLCILCPAWAGQRTQRETIGMATCGSAVM